MQHKSHCLPMSPTAHAGAQAAPYTQELRGTLTMRGHQGLALLHAYQGSCGQAVSHALHRCSCAAEIRGRCGELLIGVSPYKIFMLKKMQRSSEKD